MQGEVNSNERADRSWAQPSRLEIGAPAQLGAVSAGVVDVRGIAGAIRDETHQRGLIRDSSEWPPKLQLHWRERLVCS